MGGYPSPQARQGAKCVYTRDERAAVFLLDLDITDSSDTSWGTGAL